jgi:hypothetical protein
VLTVAILLHLSAPRTFYRFAGDRRAATTVAGKTNGPHPIEEKKRNIVAHYLETRWLKSTSGK